MEEKVGFYYCYVPGSGGAPQQRHKTIEDAKVEALRLSKKTAKTCEILHCVARTTLEPQIEELVGMTYDLHDVTGADCGYIVGQAVAVVNSTQSGFDVGTVLDRKLFAGKRKYLIKYENSGETGWVDGSCLRVIDEALKQKSIMERTKGRVKKSLVQKYGEFKVGQVIGYTYLKSLHEVCSSVGRLIKIDVTKESDPQFTVYCNVGDDAGSEYVFSLKEMREECRIVGE